MSLNSSGPINHPAFFKLANPKLGEENSSEALNPRPGEEIQFVSSPGLPSAEDLLHVCVSSPPVNTFLQQLSPSIGAWEFSAATFTFQGFFFSTF